VPIRRTFDVGACGGLEGGALIVSSYGGVASPGKTDGLWLAASVAGRASWNLLPHLAVAAEAGIVVPLLRNSFDLPAAPNDVGGIAAQSTAASFEPWPVSIRLWLGPEARF